MDILIFGTLCAVGLFSLIYVKVKAFKHRYTQGLNISKGNLLVARFVKAYDDDSLSAAQKDAVLTKVIEDMQAHNEDVKLFVKHSPEELPDNVTSIDSRYRDAV